MRKLFSDRYIMVAIAYVLLFVILIFGLFDLQYRQGDEYAQGSAADLERNLRITGNRGTIMDSTGIPLAYDQNSYQVVFYKDSSKSLDGYSSDENREKKWTNGDMYTEVIRRTIEIVEENGGTVNVSFSIRHDEEGNAKFDFSTSNEDIEQVRLERWLKNMYIPSRLYKSGDEFYKYIKDPELDVEEYKEYDITPETSNQEIKDMVATESYKLLRERYKIPDGMSYAEAYKVLSVWQEVQLSSYRSYTPVLIADDVNMDTVAAIEMNKMILEGMEVQESNIRIYPKNEVAAHVVGYMGRMLDEDTVMEKLELGYARDDLIGISGIEATMEGELTANLSSRTGSNTVEVNSRGKIIAEKYITPATDGNDVVLTLDLTMQKKLEETLEQNINITYATQLDKYNNNIEKYKSQMISLGRISEIKFAEVGAAVVMNVNSGAILAIASYPSFDPNIFTGGLTEEEYDIIKADKRNPLFNKAIASRAAPGSIFKMVTATAGLMQGAITVDETIPDLGPWSVGISEDYVGTRPSCWVRPYYNKHLNNGVADALKNSCNYYFFTVAHRLGIDDLNKWSDLLGLTSKTNVELQGEMAGQVANANTLYDPTKAPTGTGSVVFNAIKRTIKAKADELGMEIDDEVYEEVTYELMALTKNENSEMWGPDIRGILKNRIGFTTYHIMNVPKQRLDLAINQYLLELKWTGIETVLTGIGQSVTLLTPVAVCRYVSALVNGGNVYEATLVKSIVSPDGQIIEEKRPQLVRNLNIPPEYMEAIKEGMKEVVSEEDGTAKKYFDGFKYQKDLGGKTGTAQVSQIDIENNAWFVAFAPYDEPEIAIAVYIKNGLSGGNAAYTAREIIGYYLDQKLVEVSPETIPGSNDLTP